MADRSEPRAVPPAGWPHPTPVGEPAMRARRLRVRTPLVGREPDITAVREAITDESTRLLTLTGAGGAGKTRLAIAAAEMLGDLYGDGLCFVDLAAVTGADRVAGAVADAVAAALGVPEGGSSDVAGDLAYRLRERRVLLVLDNCEHVLAGAAALACRLLTDCPQVRLLATSRQALRLYGERLFPVAPLAVPRPDAPMREIATVASVELFVQRARQVRPGFTLTPGNAAAVAEICARVDGIPLALELAAARLRLFSPPALAKRIRMGLDVLGYGPADSPARHRTMRAAVAWSFDLLPPDVSAACYPLAVFVGGFGIDAARTVLDRPMWMVERLIEALVDRSLLIVDDEPPGEPRFRMLEPVRAYALEQLRCRGEEDTARTRHADYFRGLAARATPRPDVDRAAWLNTLAAEQDNLAAAVGHLMTTGRSEHAVLLAVSSTPYLLACGRAGAELRRLEECLTGRTIEDTRHTARLPAGAEDGRGPCPPAGAEDGRGPCPQDSALARRVPDGPVRCVRVVRAGPLTRREIEVAGLVADGLTNRQIASRLGLAEWTVVNHVRRVMRKLGASSRVHVARWVTQQRAAGD
jgi:predicted ATPase/DNA-binding CsgD family transcriptional regulator